MLTALGVALLGVGLLVFVRSLFIAMFHAAILLWAAGIAHVIAGNVDFALVGTILLGSIPGISIGSHLTVRLPAGLLGNALGLVMVLSALALFDKAGIDLPWRS